MKSMGPRHALDCSTGAGLPQCDCGAVQGRYRVLKPIYEKTGEMTPMPEGNIYWQRVAEWVDVGVAADMAEALKKFPRGRANGYSPVLEWIGKTH